MTRDDIIRMAREAGIGWWLDDNKLARFAALVAAAEREACARVCDVLGNKLGMGREPDPNDCAASIRERGQAGIYKVEWTNKVLEEK